MPSSLLSSRRRAWAAVLLSTLALVATSAPEPVMRRSSMAAAASASQILQFEVYISEDGVCEATSLLVKASVETEDTNVEAGTLRIVPHDPSLPIRETALSTVGSGTVLTGVADLSPLEACDDSAACRLGFDVEVTPPNAYALSVDAELVNRSSGCAVTNPSFSEDATVSVAQLP